MSFDFCDPLYVSNLELYSWLDIDKVTFNPTLNIREIHEAKTEHIADIENKVVIIRYR
jgi:hypothetical protein